jgi:NAD(P)-dependent dehydrogenase (short-subunit alcohol dehydrogenase family)
MTSPQRPQRFAGKSVLVTGAGTGFGAEIAVRAAQEGADVAVHYRSSAAGARRSAARVEAAGRKAFLMQADIVDWHSQADGRRGVGPLRAARRGGQQSG